MRQGGDAMAAGRLPTQDAQWARRALIGGAFLVMGALVMLPLGLVFRLALSEGLIGWWSTFDDPAVRHAVKLTLLTAAVAVPVNVVFGLAAAWLITRFRFPGRALLLALIDLPFTVSPIVSGLVFILLFGANGLLGPLLAEWGYQVVFAPAGIILATVFVTFPFVARELIPLMEAQGDDEELAALSLGASAWAMWTRVTLPKARWALLYGVILCNARAIGEFGAVSVVSGSIRGRTCTLPLLVEILYNEYQTRAAFAAASALALIALATLAVKEWVTWRARKQPEPAGGHA